MKPAAASGIFIQLKQKIQLMRTVSRCFVAGLPLAALARLGGAVGRSLRADMLGATQPRASVGGIET